MAVKNEDILKAVTELNKTVEKYHGDFREFRGEYVVKVKALEDDAKSQKLWHKVQTLCVIPVVGVLHQIAQHFHLIR